MVWAEVALVTLVSTCNHKPAHDSLIYDSYYQAGCGILSPDSGMNFQKKIKKEENERMIGE